ncbi:MAG: FtsQ-type POTRA domain-containing protein [Desulfobacteraceae bacterium]
MGKKPARKNRYKKSVKKRRRVWTGRLVAGAKLVSLVTAVLAASALFMAGYAAVTQSDYFRTKTIRVSGYSRLSREIVLSQAKLSPGDNLLAVNLQLVRKRLLAHPWIAAARVSREIPETMHINIKEHVCMAIVDLGRKFLLNRSGNIFKECEPNDPRKLPVVTGITYSDLSLGGGAQSQAMTHVLDVLRISRAKGSIIPYKEIRQVHWDPEMGVSLTIWNDKRTIKLGVGQFEAKCSRLEQLLPHLKQNPDWRNFSILDLNNPDRVVMRLS